MDTQIKPSVSVRDGKLIVEVPLAQIVELVAEDTWNPVNVFDPDAFGNYVAGYLEKGSEGILSGIAEKIRDASRHSLDGAGEIRAGVSLLTENVSALVAWMWQRRTPTPDHHGLGGRSLHDLVCEAAVACERGEDEKAIEWLCAPWDSDAVADALTINGREAVEAAMALYAERSKHGCVTEIG